MPYEPKPMTGSLFKSRSTHPNAPWVNGEIYLADGTKLRVSAWWATDRDTNAKRKDKHGHPWLNLTLEVDDGGQTARKAPAEAEDDDSNIPF